MPKTQRRTRMTLAALATITTMSCSLNNSYTINQSPTEQILPPASVPIHTSQNLDRLEEMSPYLHWGISAAVGAGSYGMFRKMNMSPENSALAATSASFLTGFISKEILIDRLQDIPETIRDCGLNLIGAIFGAVTAYTVEGIRNEVRRYHDSERNRNLQRANLYGKNHSRQF